MIFEVPPCCNRSASPNCAIIVRDEPLDGGGEGVGAGFVVEFYGDADDGAAFGGEIGVELIQRFGWCGDGGGDGTVGGFAEFGFETADDGDDAGVGAERAQEEFAAGGLGESELGAGVDGAEVIEILRASRKAEELRGVRGGLDAEEAVEGELGDAVLHGGGVVVLFGKACKV